MVCCLLTAGLLTACLAGCSKSEVPNRSGKPLIGQTNAVPLVSLLSAEGAAETSIADLKAKAEKGDISAQVVLGFKYVEGLGVATNSDEGLRLIARGISQMEDRVAKAMARTNARFEGVARQVDINICACRLGDNRRRSPSGRESISSSPEAAAGHSSIPASTPSSSKSAFSALPVGTGSGPPDATTNRASTASTSLSPRSSAPPRSAPPTSTG